MSWVMSLVAAAFKGLSSTVLVWWTAKQAEGVRLKLQRREIELREAREQKKARDDADKIEKEHNKKMADHKYNPLDDV